jgi:hypothetical protein
MIRTDPTGDFETSSIEVTDTVVAGEGPTEPGWPAEISQTLPITDELTPIPTPIPLPYWPPWPPWWKSKRKVSGRYSGTSGMWKLELRVDVDGQAIERPMKRISGDFYKIYGGTTYYFGSFVVNSPNVNITDTTVTAEGMTERTFNASYPKVKVTIPRTIMIQRPSPATVQWLSTSNAKGALYSCPWESSCFRSIKYEQDYEQGITPFTSYYTGSLPSGGLRRTLSVVKAYREAGIEFQVSTAANAISPVEAGVNQKWSDSELHASMLNHFSLWKDSPQWMVWLFAADEHEDGPGLYGIMFDQQGKQRQGCATFHTGIGGTTSDKLRLQLYTYVHELGHCFNLLHSWQKSYATPPAPNRPNSLSWMNYPWYYPGGPSAFWTSFPFQFDDLELIHLRHAFRNNIIMGGNDFITGSALTAIKDPEAFNNPIEDNSALQLRLEAPSSFFYGEPVVVEIQLRTTSIMEKQVLSHLHPKKGLIQIGIRKPSGQIILYQPLIEQCWGPEISSLNSEQPAIYDSAYIGYGKDGFYFDEIGVYKIRAIYYSIDGSQVVSNLISVRVRSPLKQTDEEIADLFIGDEQGKLLSLLGSDSVFLQKGNNAFDQVIQKYSEHPLAVYANLIKGINVGRDFKQITSDKRIEVRRLKLNESIEHLTSVVEASEADKGVDNITLNQVMRSMTRTQRLTGNDADAESTMERMVSFFEKKNFKPHVMRTIREQASNALKEKL